MTESSVMRRQRSWFSVNEESIHIRNVASVNITTGLIWSVLSIESSGGSDPISSNGHTKRDARRIKELIDTLQVRLGAGASAGTVAIPDGDTKTCPYCAETIKKAAKLCRFCNRTLD